MTFLQNEQGCAPPTSYPSGHQRDLPNDFGHRAGRGRTRVTSSTSPVHLTRCNTSDSNFLALSTPHRTISVPYGNWSAFEGLPCWHDEGRKEKSNHSQPIPSPSRSRCRPYPGHANSEILKSLAQLSKAVRKAKPDTKFVVVASDMIEHSKNLSFYEKKRLRQIVPEQELAKARELGLLANFDDASVAIIGAGVIPEAEGGTEVRDEKALSRLRLFWEDWVQASSGNWSLTGSLNFLRSSRGTMRPKNRLGAIVGHSRKLMLHGQLRNTTPY